MKRGVSQSQRLAILVVLILDFFVSLDMGGTSNKSEHGQTGHSG